jgi:hypothetical protein
MTTNFVNQTGTATAAKPKTSWGTTIVDTLKFGVSTWSDIQKRQAEADTAQAAINLEKLKLAEAQAKLEAAKTESSSKSSVIKSYGTPILITGLVVALGIGTYFYFRKKSA